MASELYAKPEEFPFAYITFRSFPAKKYEIVVFPAAYCPIKTIALLGALRKLSLIFLSLSLRFSTSLVLSDDYRYF